MDSLFGSVFGHSAAPPKEEKRAISEVTEEVLYTFLGENWRRRGFKHLTFRSEVFNLHSIEGLLKSRLDLTFLESLDVSENSLTELECIAGESARLMKEQVPQGLMFFSNLQVLKVRKNLLTSFKARLPSLRELDLSHNKLKGIPPVFLLPKLEVLLLNHNEINGAFLDLRKCEALKRLDLSFNQLDFNASRLKGELKNLAHLPNLILKIKDNPFSATFPTYQVLVLQELPHLRKLDDISDMSSARQAAAHVALNLKKLDEFAFKNQDSKVSETLIKNSTATAAVFRPAGKKTVFAEISGFLVRALQDPDAVQIAVAGLTRLTHTISQCIPEDMDNLQEELEQGPLKPREKIQTLMGDFEVLAGRIAGPNQKILLLRAIAKLSVVDVEGLGVECMKLLRRLTELNPHLEERVVGMLQEMIVHPLKNYCKEKGPDSQERVGSYIRILANFDSPGMGAALQPITTELVEMYCKPNQVQARFTIRGDSPIDPLQEQQALAIVKLTECWSSFDGNLKLKELPDSGIVNITTKLSQILEAEAARPIYDHDPKAHAETMAHLGLALNLLNSKVQRVEKVFRNSGSTKNSIHHRAVQKVMVMFGNAKKAEPNASVKLDAITSDNEILIAKLFDVLGAFLALSDSDVFVQDILEGSLSLPKFITAIVKEDPISRPALYAGALRLSRSIVDTYMDVKEPHAETVTQAIIAALSEMRPMMKLLTMSGTYFEHLWKACTGNTRNEVEQALPRPRTLEQPLVLEIFEAIIRLVSVFSLTDGPLYAEVRKVVSHQREELMFQMLTVPDAKVKVAALECVGTASVADTSISEVETLISFLDVKGEELQSSFTYLQKIVAQLHRMLTAQTGQGAVALRTTQAKACKEGVLGILVRTARYLPTNNEVLKSRVSLLQACLQFLHAAGSIQEWRLQLRTKMATFAIVTSLQCEDSQGLHIPDISVERTWTGRSVETLLMTLSGPERLRAKSKVALRVISRMADSLEGQSDHVSGLDELQALPDHLVEQLTTLEAGQWDQEKVKKHLGHMDDVTREDWRVQQEIFTSANGLERVELFLGGLLSERQRTESRQHEAAILRSAAKFLDDAKASATRRPGEDGASDVESEDSEEAFFGGGISQEPLIDMAPRDFSGRDGFGAYEDLKQTYAGRLQPVFSILFTARWYSFRNWSSIVDFGDGPGQENVIIANQGRSNSLVFQVYRRGNVYTAVAPAVLKLNESCTYLCTMSEDGVMRIYRGGEVLGSCRNVPQGVAGSRKYLYVGKSCWADRELFHGRIEQLKVWGGQVVDWEDVAEDLGENDEGGTFARKLIMKELLSVSESAPLPPKVHGALNLLTPPSSQEETDILVGELDPGYIVAATMRCAYALLQAPASPKAEHEMVSTLLDSTIITRLLTLVRTVGPFNCGCALKVLQLMGEVLERCSDNPDVDMLVTCDLLMGYVSEVVGEAERGLQHQSGSSNWEKGRLLSQQIAQVCSVICKFLPYCKYVEDDKQGQNRFLECCYDRLVPSSLVPSLVRMALYADDSKSMMQMVEDTRTVLVKLMERCPTRKRDTVETLCSILLSGEADNGLSWMAQLHEAVKISEAERQREEMEAAKAFGTQKVKLEDGQPERALGTYNVEVLINGRCLQVSNPSHHAPFLNLVITNKAVHVVDTTVPGYPKENTGQLKECSFQKADLIRITRGFLDQVIFLGFKSGAAPDEGETTMPVIFHRRNARENALSKLTQLKQLPIDQDKMTDEAVTSAIQGDLLSATHSPGEHSLFNAVLLRDGLLKLYILNEAAVHDFQVDYSQWRPAREELEDAPQDEPQVPLLPDVKALRDITDRDTTPELWKTARSALLTRVGEVRSLDKLDTVAFFPDSRPRVEMTFQDLEGVNITFFDELSKEHWREAMMGVLKQEDDGKGGGWSRNVNGAKMPLT